jgi:addiction module HigA family antidote
MNSKMEKFNNIHPGEILEKDFLEPMNLSAYALAKGIGVDQTRISQLIRGKRKVIADTALRLSRFFQMSAEFWLNAQSRYDLEEEKKHNVEYNKIKPFEKV